MRIETVLAALAIPALVGCADLGDEEIDGVEDVGPAPEVGEDGIPVDLQVHIADVEQMIAEGDVDAVEATMMATVQGEHMGNLHWTDIWGHTRLWWGNGSRARAWVYVPYRSWRHINVVGGASRCTYQPGFHVDHANAAGNIGGGIHWGGVIGAGIASYYLGTVILEAGWNRIDLTMWGDQWQPGVCDANIVVDYLWIP